MIPLRDDIRSQRLPIVNFILIGLNCLVYIYEVGLGQELRFFINDFGFVPYNLIYNTDAHSILTLFTSMFIHANFLHIAGNLLYLWVFGDNVEDVFSPIGFLFFYLVCGLAGSLLHTLFSARSVIPSVGASGAISGVMGGYFLLYPRARVLALVPLGFFMRLIYVPAVFFLGFWFVLQLLYGFALWGANAGVAYFAHIGGFVAGVIIALPFKFKQRSRYRIY
ncbi:MAG: rhomboid family intramembrane serine protease [candidate division WOR-3 bacterium]